LLNEAQVKLLINKEVSLELGIKSDVNLEKYLEIISQASFTHDVDLLRGMFGELGILADNVSIYQGLSGDGEIFFSYVKGENRLGLLRFTETGKVLDIYTAKEVAHLSAAGSKILISSVFGEDELSNELHIYERIIAHSITSAVSCFRLDDSRSCIKRNIQGAYRLIGKLEERHLLSDFDPDIKLYNHRNPISLWWAIQQKEGLCIISYP